MASGGSSPDVAIIGAGILGTSAAAFLTKAGASVLLADGVAIGAGASGRNSGAIQHPFDPVLARLYHRTIELYGDLTEATSSGGGGFRMPPEPAGVLLLSQTPGAVETILAGVEAEAPELSPAVLEGAILEAAEPILAPGVSACRLSTGYPVPPAGATSAYASLAGQRGASIRLGNRAALWVEDRTVRGIVVNGEHVAAGSVLVAGGPWSPAIVSPSGGWQPIVPIWGVNVGVELPARPRHVLEEAGVEHLAHSPLTRGDADESSFESAFSLVTVGRTSTLGSTFLPLEPDRDRLAPELKRRGSAFVPSLASSRIQSTRLCARPQSRDRRPLLGAVAGVDGLFIAAGHGQWGISTGPASAELVVDVILGRTSVPPELDPGRFGVPAIGEAG
ncbi:MAG: FAD-binding oxidoreductase [Chloroflexi bacterium]|nr:MAG: FAD-binding oxidoreductase [Chloroflexota bacterium]